MGIMLAKDALNARYSIFAFNKYPKRVNFGSRRLKLVGLKHLIQRSDIIAVAVPLNDAPKVLERVKTLVNVEKHPFVFDIATIKKGLEEIYREFPENVMVASAHRMFGPGAGTLKEEKYLFFQLRVEKEEHIHLKNF
ncbi:MAG: hypothetical protein DRJ47_01560 [Thermoprotei archaeon]|nr:MAG: hypothetical protein DRJ47_01560 [Thermoprotei archaeon]